jgi:hypothetical protein
MQIEVERVDEYARETVREEVLEELRMRHATVAISPVADTADTQGLVRTRARVGGEGGNMGKRTPLSPFWVKSK